MPRHDIDERFMNTANDEYPMENKETPPKNDFWVECQICKQHLKNWTGSTPCCGSIAYIVEDGIVSSNISLFGSVDGDIKPVKIKLS